tara:strand:+ start:52 stop:390 length:339 start_codon:yes stop_codon:yes gene_type:complete
MALEVTLKHGKIFLEDEMQKLLSNKDKLVGKELKDGRNQYQVEIQKLKDRIKAENKKVKEEGFKNLKYSFKDLLKHVKKQESEGKFDRGAEGETKKKLRAKMADKKPARVGK